MTFIRIAPNFNLEDCKNGPHEQLLGSRPFLAALQVQPKWAQPILGSRARIFLVLGPHGPGFTWSDLYDFTA